MVNLSAITKTKFFILFFNGLIFLSSILLSCPLYALYLCFFTPYIIKIFSFLYPLFITTSLVLISFVTIISPRLVEDTSSSTESSLLSVYDVVTQIFQCKLDDDTEGEYFRSLEALEMYKIVFDTPMLDEYASYVYVSEECPEEKILRTVESSVLKTTQNVKTEEALKGNTIAEQDSSIDDSQLESIKSVIEKFEAFSKKSDFEIRDCNTEIKKVQKEINQTFDEQNTEQSLKIVHYGNSVSKSKNPQSRRQSTRTTINYTENHVELASKDEIFQHQRCDIGNYGSMRKAREYRSTLACKLFEEKHNNCNVDGIEGMDLLWEKYDEVESMNENTKNETKTIDSSKSRNGKYVYGEEDDKDNDFGVHLCCLQALKLSASKMNLSVGRRNLTKISKAVKGLGWVHKPSKHSKKIHNNGETVQFA